MKSKVILTVIALFIINSSIYAQFDINDRGMVNIVANTQDWWSGLKVTVPTLRSCVYNLSYAGKDRFYVCAEGLALV